MMSIRNTKKLKELEEENEELKSFFRKIYEKEDTIRHLKVVLRDIRAEIADLKEEKAQLTKTIDNLHIEINDFANERNNIRSEIQKLENAKTEAKTKLDEINSRLYQAENDLEEFEPDHEKINPDLSKEIEEAEKKNKELSLTNKIFERKISHLNNGLNLLQQQEKEITEKIKIKREELEKINSPDVIQTTMDLKMIEDKIRKLKDAEAKITVELKERIKRLKEEEDSLKESIVKKRCELNAIDSEKAKEKLDEVKTSEDKLIALMMEEQKLNEEIGNKKIKLNDLNTTLASLTEKTKIIKENLAQLKTTEDLKTELITELNDNLSEKEIKLAGLEQEIEDHLKRAKTDLEKKLDTKSKEIKNLDNQLTLKSSLMSKMAVDLTSIEDRLKRTQAEANDYEKRRDEAHRQTLNYREEHKKLKEEAKILKELIPLLEQRKIEIKHSNESLENRFADILQKVTEEINKINKKRSALEQIILKREKDVEEKDHVLNEKVTALEESDRVLSLRQEEINSFETLLKNINEQKEILKNELLNLDRKASEQRSLIGDLHLETEMLQNKKLAVEQNLQDVLYSINNRLKKTGESNIKLNTEVKEYENRLNSLNNSIKESMNELLGLQTSISSIKIEHEEHRSGITKLVSMKKKLQDEISKHHSILQKYQKISEKVKLEKALVQNMKSQKTQNGTNSGEVKINRDSHPGDQFLKI
jgi:chromosome segregation ATPase